MQLKACKILACCPLARPEKTPWRQIIWVRHCEQVYVVVIVGQVSMLTTGVPALMTAPPCRAFMRVSEQIIRRIKLFVVSAPGNAAHVR